MTDDVGVDEMVTEPGEDVPPAATAEQLIAAVIDVLTETRPVPLSSNVMVPRDELVAALEDARAALPEEIRAARWLLKEREEFLASARTEADEIVSAARSQAEQMVRRTELVRQSEIHGRRIRDEAEAEARHWRRQTEDFCEQRLAQFEMTLGRIARVVQEGRERLSELPQVASEDKAGQASDADVIDLTDERVGAANSLFDQDDAFDHDDD